MAQEGLTFGKRAAQRTVANAGFCVQALVGTYALLHLHGAGVRSIRRTTLYDKPSDVKLVQNLLFKDTTDGSKLKYYGPDGKDTW